MPGGIMPAELRRNFLPKMNDMSRDEETYLSAYMDGQLDSDQQQLVESALVASPELAENLRALATVRELVAGLHRDTCADISPAVMRRIRGLSRSRSALLSYRPEGARARQVTAVVGTLTVAAAIMLIVTVIFSPRPRDHGPPVTPRAGIDNVIADSGPGVSAASTDEVTTRLALAPGSSASTTGTIHSAAPDTQPVAAHTAAAAVAVEGHVAPGDLEHSRRMLDNPAERRLFLIKNGKDGKAQQQVASVVERTTRFGFFKFTVSQGIVIDPRHPDEATVFALLVNPKELGRLRDQLKEALPDLIEETPADPEIVTQLADIGRVQEFAGAGPADVSIFREDMALRTKVGGVDSGAQAALPAGEKTSARPTPEQYRSAPVPPTSRSGSVSEPEHGTDTAAVDDAGRAPEATASARRHLSDPVSGARLLPSRPTLAGDASGTAKPDEMILVFVWVYQPRPS